MTGVIGQGWEEGLCLLSVGRAWESLGAGCSAVAAERGPTVSTPPHGGVEEAAKQAGMVEDRSLT